MNVYISVTHVRTVRNDLFANCNMCVHVFTSLHSFDCLFGCWWFNVPVTSYGHVETISSPNQQAYTKRLTSAIRANICTFACN